MIDVRPAREIDRDALRAMMIGMHAELRPDLPFDADCWDDTVTRCLVEPWPTILIVTISDEPAGFLLANKCHWESATGFFIFQRLIYVRPDHRGSRAAATLLTRFVTWAETFNPTEICCGIGEGKRSRAAGRFLTSLGFSPAGQQIVRRPGSVQR